MPVFFYFGVSLHFHFPICLKRRRQIKRIHLGSRIIIIEADQSCPDKSRYTQNSGIYNTCSAHLS